MDDYSKELKFSFLPSYKGVDFVLKVRHSDIKLNDISTIFYNEMQPYSFGYDNDSFAEFIIKELSTKNITISLAESCTGGLLSSKITSKSGVSKIFNMGLITYSNKAKSDLLNIIPSHIKKYGSLKSKRPDLAKQWVIILKDLVYI